MVGCKPGATPSGNLTAYVANVQGVSPFLGPVQIKSGNQSVPFARAGDMPGAAEPVLTVKKTVTTAGATARASSRSTPRSATR